VAAAIRGPDPEQATTIAREIAELAVRYLVDPAYLDATSGES
jgi:hypothetical protein